jgi:hypothetical protein
LGLTITGGFDAAEFWLVGDPGDAADVGPPSAGPTGADVVGVAACCVACGVEGAVTCDRVTGVATELPVGVAGGVPVALALLPAVPPPLPLKPAPGALAL